jgi:hypothetical protein
MEERGAILLFCPGHHTRPLSQHGKNMLYRPHLVGLWYENDDGYLLPRRQIRAEGDDQTGVAAVLGVCAALLQLCHQLSPEQVA